MSGDGFNRRSALTRMGGSIVAAHTVHAAAANAQPIEPRGGTVRFEDFGAVGDGVSDDSPAITAALQSGARILPEFITYASAATLTVNHDGVCDLGGALLRQASGANLDEIVRVAISNSRSKLQSASTIVVDGNRAQNSAEVTGITVAKLKKALGTLTAAAQDCTTGISITGQSEYCAISAHAEGCGTGVEVLGHDRTTPDELRLDVFAHDCGTFLRSTGSRKVSGIIAFACEQSDDWGVILEGEGWWQITGIIRGVGKQRGGGMRVDGAQLRGDLEIVGASGENCEWGLDIKSGQINGFSATINGQYANGVRIAGGAQGSAKVFLQTVPRGKYGVVLGAGPEPLDGFVIEEGSRLRAGSGTTALALEDCRNCRINPGILTGICTISAKASGNTVHVPRKGALGQVTFDNKRTQSDNRIRFRGVYTLAELNTINSGKPFRGMEAEMCSDFDMRRALFDGQSWIAT